MTTPRFLDELAPHDPDHSAAQIAGLLDHLAPPPKHVLDLGVGGGRVLKPLVDAGHDVVGIDIDPQFIESLRGELEAAKVSADLGVGDFTDPGFWEALGPREERFDAVLLLGNTLMTIAAVEEAVSLFTRIRAALRPGGWFIIDDIPHDFWPEVIEGNWQTGLSDEASQADDDQPLTTAEPADEPIEPMQMIWHEADAIFTLRMGEAVDLTSWSLRPDDQRFRLWTLGALELVARSAGLSVPRHVADAHLLIFQAT